jgi:hypothetical protein
MGTLGLVYLVGRMLHLISFMAYIWTLRIGVGAKCEPTLVLLLVEGIIKSKNLLKTFDRWNYPRNNKVQWNLAYKVSFFLN